VAAFAEAEAGGLASIQVDGRFVDYPIVQKAERILAIAAKIRAARGG
jgi:citrate lyase subunit beta/citryl-CoA lyase